MRFDLACLLAVPLTAAYLVEQNDFGCVSPKFVVLDHTAIPSTQHTYYRRSGVGCWRGRIERGADPRMSRGVSPQEALPMHDASQPVHGKAEVGDHATVYGSVVGVNTGTINNFIQIAQVVTSLHQLRAPLADFVGRQREIATLLAALHLQADGMAALAAICGMGGLGKTELALRIGHALRDE